jgi:hypothetical protein
VEQAPIIGSTKLDSIKELVEAVNIQLSEDEVKVRSLMNSLLILTFEQAIEAPYKAREIFGHS